MSNRAQELTIASPMHDWAEVRSASRVRVIPFGAGPDVRLMRVLMSSTALTSLNLSHTGFGLSQTVGVLASGLATNTTLTQLNMTSNWLGHCGLEAFCGALCANTTLTELNLTDNMLGQADGQLLPGVLRRNSTLTSLDIGFNELGHGGSVALAAALAGEATSLTSLDLRNNGLGDVDGRALLRTVAVNSVLTRLNLDNNSIGAETLRRLRQVAGKV